MKEPKCTPTKMHVRMSTLAKANFLNNLLVFWHKAVKPKAISLVSLKGMQSSKEDQAVL